jgi:hypothetical protein
MEYRGREFVGFGASADGTDLSSAPTGMPRGAPVTLQPSPARARLRGKGA